MKTITIPKRFGYPTVDIYINNKTYTLKSGEPITVDDNVAAIIENAIALAPKQGMNKSRLAQRIDGTIEEITEGDLAGISAISHSALSNCKSLIRISIPNTVTSIGTYAFDWCTNMKSVYLPEIPPALGVGSFGNIHKDCIFYCNSQESLNAYKAATNWSTLTGTYTFKVEG